MTGRPATDVIRRANASKLLLITTKNKNQRKNQDFALDYFLSPKAMPAAGYANA
ncbi:putative restriction /modification enzyme (plasmid) [Nostoc flagelliforme CCNUN1]|uniref:Putative restriction /modification enzyme n=2 Tax=Nostoc flagelliforme TaxID=1306274 RepID=A0A2K8T8F2_9NOSO|nr:putative restriction /modification enzyme [Nostoc flagelliforme CCNUN1]